jgi:hypothetical protein
MNNNDEGLPEGARTLGKCELLGRKLNTCMRYRYLEYFKMERFLGHIMTNKSVGDLF